MLFSLKMTLTEEILEETAQEITNLLTLYINDIIHTEDELKEMLEDVIVLLIEKIM